MIEWGKFPDFQASEFACSHCGKVAMDEDFVQLLQAIRAELGIPLVINSGYRCPIYNAEISSSGYNGSHTLGLAVDIKVNSAVTRARIFEAAYKRGVRRFGIAKTFIHLDTSTQHPSPAIWGY